MDNLTHLRTFCSLVVRKYTSPEWLSTDKLAEEFLSHYIDIPLKNFPVDMATLSAVARACGATVSPHRMPGKLRGYHEVIDGNRVNIYYREDDSLSGKENTILHELREIMEPFFAGFCSSYNPLSIRALHREADRFAAAVLLPQGPFRDKVYETGLDIPALGQFYAKSHAQILLRIGEVLHGERFFYGAVYDAEPGFVPIFRVSYWAGSANQDIPEANFYGPRGFLPRKGKSAELDSLVEMAADSLRPCHVNRIFFSEYENNDLTAVAQPVVNGDEVSRVCLLVLLHPDRKLLKPLLERVRPITVASFDGHL